MAQDKYATWYSKQEAAQRLGISERTLERKIEAGEISTAQRRIPGRKPMTVCSPADVDRLAEATAQPVVETLPAEETLPVRQTKTKSVAGAAAASPAALLQVLAANLDRTPKLYLTLEEASAYTGLTQAYLMRKIQAKEVPAVRDVSWKIRRSELDKL